MLSANSVADWGSVMNKKQLVQRLRRTANYMELTAEYLALLYGSSSEAVQHAAELLGASTMVAQWADELEKEEAK